MGEKPGPKRGPYAKTRQRRDAIGRAALEILIGEGQEAVTAARVSDRTGLTEATVAYHCPTRDHLLVAALAQADKENEPLFTDSGAAGRTLEELLALPVSAYSGHENRLRLYTLQAANAADPAHPAHRWFLERSGSAKAFFADLLRHAQNEGGAHPDVDPERFGRQMVAVWDGLQMQWLAGRDFDLGTEVVEAYRSLARCDLAAARRSIEELARAL